MMGKVIYLDNAATTKVYDEVVEAMLPYFTEYYGNPSAVYTFAGQANKAVTIAREQIAKVIGARTDEIYFTGGGSESDNWALKAVIEEYGEKKGKHIIIRNMSCWGICFRTGSGASPSRIRAACSASPGIFTKIPRPPASAASWYANSLPLSCTWVVFWLKPSCWLKQAIPPVLFRYPAQLPPPSYPSS